ncbi:MAG: nitroreductase [Burkholderiales bacterium]|nr:MAG: nitroreductase [Burkholderiales bacterium]
MDVRSRDYQPEVESEFAETLITSRQNTSPRRLVEPGPSVSELARILRAAAAAPDHGLLRPWRFVIVPKARRADLAEVFALALIDRDPGATLDQIEAARDKAHRAPMLMLVVARLGVDEARIPPLERMVSVGCAVQNMLLMAHSLGLGSGLTSGQAMPSARMRGLFQLTEGEEAVCFLNMGTVAKRKLGRAHPGVQDFLSTL